MILLKKLTNNPEARSEAYLLLITRGLTWKVLKNKQSEPAKKAT